MASREAKAPAKIPPHKHCKVCGLSIPPNKVYCSNECMEQDRKAQRRLSMMNRLFTISLLALLLFLLLPFLLSLARP
jgi:predicted nucleic acid-binding Zn ribbon protein